MASTRGCGTRKFPIIIVNILSPGEVEALWQQGGLQALAGAIAADLRQPEIGGIIKIPVKEKVPTYDEA